MLCFVLERCHPIYAFVCLEHVLDPELLAQPGDAVGLGYREMMDRKRHSFVSFCDMITKRLREVIIGDTPFNAKLPILISVSLIDFIHIWNI